MKKHIFLSAGAMLVSMALAAQQLPLDTAVVFGKLPNGLTYYVRHNEEPRE